MAMQEKIERIIEGTNAAIEAMIKAGTLTTEKHMASIENMNQIIRTVVEQET